MPPPRVNSQDLGVVLPLPLSVLEVDYSSTNTLTWSRLARLSHFQTLLWFFTGGKKKKKESDGLLYSVTPVYSTYPLDAMRKPVLWKQNQNSSSVLSPPLVLSLVLFLQPNLEKNRCAFQWAKLIISTLVLGVLDEIHPSSQVRHSGSIPFSNS